MTKRQRPRQTATEAEIAKRDWFAKTWRAALAELPEGTTLMMVCQREGEHPRVIGNTQDAQLACSLLRLAHDMLAERERALTLQRALAKEAT